MARQETTPRKTQERIEPLRRGSRQSENAKKWSALIAQAWVDEKLKRRLVDSPAKVLKEQGVEVPAGVEIRLVEDTEKIRHVILPAKPSASITVLEGAAGGAVVGGAGALKDAQSSKLSPPSVSPGDCWCNF